MTALSKLIGSELFAMCSFGDRWTVLPRICMFPDSKIGLAAEQFIGKRQHFLAHPVIHHYAETRDGQALAISDFLSESEFHRQEILYSGFFRSVGLEDQMMMTIELPAKLKTGLNVDQFHQGKSDLSLTISRARRGFAERERLLLNLIRPHLKQAYENIVTFNQLNQLLSEHQEAIEQTALILLSANGKVKWLTQPAGEILHRYFPLSKARISLPEPLQGWIERHVLPFSKSTETCSTIRPLVLELN
ncbi:MAG: hypothetical protein F6K32_21885, partial [Desertifilum sp. SIO1I2]|nr:hypothetical protein [Desertifilum sp. SIO1I2]